MRACSTLWLNVPRQWYRFPLQKNNWKGCHKFVHCHWVAIISLLIAIIVIEYSMLSIAKGVLMSGQCQSSSLLDCDPVCHNGNENDNDASLIPVELFCLSYRYISPSHSPARCCGTGSAVFSQRQVRKIDVFKHYWSLITNCVFQLFSSLRSLWFLWGVFQDQSGSKCFTWIIYSEFWVGNSHLFGSFTNTGISLFYLLFIVK